ncbi:glycosyltransferase family 4 protein [Polymorphospora rubra]|uniref:glycosyltransferase family 4 protein n=1 Tax=Polymorphospora rubra TaxID=338584 RepID=UPI00341105AA
MRILLIGPTGGGGSLPPYLNVLAEALRLHGAQVERLGHPGVPYDPQTAAFWPAERIIRTAEQLLDGVDLHSYDLISLHYGNLEIEQLLPSLWKDTPRPPVVHHLHSLDWTLFTTHVPDSGLRSAVDDGIKMMDGFIFFGTYGHAQLTRRHQLDVPTTVTWLPTTIPAGTHANAGPELSAALTGDHGPLGSLYGFAAPWKDPAGLIEACQGVSSACRILLAGPSWNNPDEAGTDLSREACAGVQHGNVRVEVVTGYLDPGHRRALAQHSDFAVFPYRTQPTFQGSGAIADYLAHGVPVLATDVANMAELVGDAGLIVEPGDPDAFTDALERFASDDSYRDALARQAQRRSRQFGASYHAGRCLRLYQSVIDQTTAAP